MAKDSRPQANGIKINERPSSIVEFTRRPLPSEQEMRQFDEYIEEEAKEEEIEESLNEIYQDERGKAVDVSRLEIKRKRGFVFWFLGGTVALSVLSVAGYAVFLYYLASGIDATAVDFRITGDTEVAAGEEYSYDFTVENKTGVILRDVQLEASWPKNFIYLDASVPPAANGRIWSLGELAPRETKRLSVKGKIIAPADTAGIALATLTYMPVNFSSEFKKEASFTTAVDDIGLHIEADYTANVLVGEENEIEFVIEPQENGMINSFRLTIEPLENFNFAKTDYQAFADRVKIIRPGVIDFTVGEEEEKLPVKFSFTKKMNDDESVPVYLEYAGPDGVYYRFFETALAFHVMKNDLNLTLIVNGSRDDQGVNFGEALSYSIVYANKGDTEMKDVVIMAVLESDFLDWTTLTNPLNGREKGNTISWSKEEIPGLEAIGRNEEGTIDFSIKVSEAGRFDLDRDYQVRSYAQFSIGNSEELSENAETRSNQIINKINSDIVFEESVRYFSEDNIAVGTGPLPPRAGERTTFKVYWTVKNNLHELADTVVSTVLPEYVEWDGKDRAAVGSIGYDPDTRRVSWNIGRLPVSVFRTDAEFSVGYTPREEDRNKVVVVLTGSAVSAVDSETNAALTKATKAQTTKLEGDQIANSDGMIR